MSEMAKFEARKKSLQGICDENNLVFRFRNDAYPITLTIMPTGGVGAQMSLLENVEERGYMSPDAKIVFYYEDGVLTYKTSETFTVNDALFSKIKNLYKNMHFLWLQFFNREIIERGMLKELPRIEQEEIYDDDDDGDSPTVKTTVDGSGLVTNVEFSGGNSEPDDDEPPEDYIPEDGDPPGDEDNAENGDDDYPYDDPEGSEEAVPED